MSKILRLLLFEDCNRSCDYCCNQYWDLPSLPMITDFTPYTTILLTGGEPMLHPPLVKFTIRMINEQNNWAKIIMYTADVCDTDIIGKLWPDLDGLTVTLHNQVDAENFNKFQRILIQSGAPSKSLRLNVSPDVDLTVVNTTGWKVKHKKWFTDRVYIDGETFGRLA